MKRRSFFKSLALCAALATAGFASLDAAAQAKTVKVGVLHSLSGTMAISETVLKDVALMAFDEINAAGGVMGHKIEAVVVDPASNWPLFAEKARQLLTQDKVAAVFGCWTSVSRKSVLPVFEELNGLLFYPVQYEGEELSKNVFYTGAAPNQQAIPAVEYLMSKDGGGAKRWVLLGTDYVYPRTTNKILRAFLKSKGVKDSDIDEKYTPFGHSDYQTIVADVKKFAAGGKTAVISTINGDSNVPFYKELGNQGLKATDVPVVAFSVLESVYAELEKISAFVLTEKMTDAEAGKVLARIAKEEDLNGRIRRNVMDTRRAVSFLMRQKLLQPDQAEEARQILRDIESLDGHTAFLFDKINFLMDATVGFININQNKIIKIFSVASVALLPPTLIASIYGMNFKGWFPELEWSYGYPFALGLMLVSVVVPFAYFKRKGWLD